MGIVLIIVGIAFFGLGYLGLKKWYADRDAGNPNPPTNWKLSVGFFLGTICVMLGVAMYFNMLQ